jgi:hypothetical protein
MTTLLLDSNLTFANNDPWLHSFAGNVLLASKQMEIWKNATRSLWVLTPHRGGGFHRPYKKFHDIIWNTSCAFSDTTPTLSPSQNRALHACWEVKPSDFANGSIFMATIFFAKRGTSNLNFGLFTIGII